PWSGNTPAGPTRSGRAMEGRHPGGPGDGKAPPGRVAAHTPAGPRARGRAVLPAGGRGIRVRVPAIAGGLPDTAGTLSAEPNPTAHAAKDYLRPDAPGLPRLHGRHRRGSLG